MNTLLGTAMILSALTLQPDVKTAQPPGEPGGGGHRSVVLASTGEVREPISVHAAQSVVLRLGVTGQATALKNEYFNQLGRDVIDSLRKRGLSLVGLRRISFLPEAPAGSVPLTTRNQSVWDLLAPSDCDGEISGDEVTVCIDSDACQCITCETITIEPLCDPEDPHPVCTD